MHFKQTYNDCVFFIHKYRNVEEAVKFPGLPQHRQLTYATKQLIAREVIQLYYYYLGKN